MWLPKDERHLLLAYYVNIFNIDDRNVCRYLDNPKWFEMSDWIAVLEKPSWIPILTPWLIKHDACKVKAYGDGADMPNEEDKSMEQVQEEIKRCIRLEKKLKISNAGLERRGFIKVQKHQHCGEVVGISLSIKGYDLGRKYSSWWTRSGLWFAEYKNHWIWIIISFLGGVIGALLINWLST